MMEEEWGGGMWSLITGGLKLITRYVKSASPPLMYRHALWDFVDELQTLVLTLCLDGY